MRFIDSNVFAYHLAGDVVHGKRAREILKSIEGGEEVATSTLVISQVCSYFKLKRFYGAIEAFLSLIGGLKALKTYETTIKDFEEARKIQREEGLPLFMWDDIVIAAQMKRLGISEIYSNDNDFDKFPWIKRIF